MAPKFSARSLAELATVNPRLRATFEELGRWINLSALEGHRDMRRQNRLHADRLTKVRWPDSKHNAEPSDALDAVPWPVDYKVPKFNALSEDVRQRVRNYGRLCFFAGAAVATARAHGFKLRWGGLWAGLTADGRIDLNGQRFDDLGHFEDAGDLEQGAETDVE